MKAKNSILVLLICICFTNLFSQNKIDCTIIDAKKENFVIENFRVFADSNAIYTYEQICKENLDSFFTSSSSIDDSIKQYWIKFKLKNTSSKDLSVLLNYYPWRKVKLYEMDSLSTFSIMQNGYELSPNLKDYIHYTDCIQLYLPKDSICNYTLLIDCSTMYMNIENHPNNVLSRKKDKSKIQLSVLRANQTNKNLLNAWIATAVVLAVLLIIIFQNLITYFIIKDIAYIYLIFFILSAFFYEAALDHVVFYLIPITDKTEMFIMYITSTFMLPSFVLFVTEFLNIKAMHPRLYRNSIFFITFYFFVAALLTYSIHIENIVIYKLTVGFINVSILLSIIMVIVLCVYLSRHGHKFAKQFLFLNSPFFVFVLIFVLQERNLGVIAESYFTVNSLRIGTIIQCMFYSIALSFRFKFLLIENANFEKQKVLEINRLTEEKNIELNQKVIERTADIMRQKDEILSINQELYQRNEEINTQNEEIIRKNDEIEAQHHDLVRINRNLLESIFYAKRIQEAVLPDDEFIKSVFPNSFILYHPRNIVSGDFYWMKKIDNLIYFAAADCTGHGVPGAFMSVLGISLLNEIAIKESNTTPNVILNLLRDRIKTTLKQTGKSNEIKDGMDIAFCILDIEKNKLHFAGAENPLVLFRKKENNECEFLEYKGDKIPIGSHPNDHNSFTLKTIDIEHDDTIYIFSDGFHSQFGSSRNIKFTKKRFRELLVQTNELPIQMQKEFMENRFNEWRMNFDQTDDILVIGIELTKN